MLHQTVTVFEMEIREPFNPQNIQLRVEEEREAVHSQLCNLKYKCATSLCILVVLLLEALMRRIEQYLKHDRP